MTPGLCATCLVAPLVLVVAWVSLRAALATRRRPAMHYRTGFDATHPVPPVSYDYLWHDEAHEPTVAGIWEPNPMTETCIVARPLGWDAQPRKEYER